MTKRQVVVLCEDRTHYHFVRGYLAARGWDTRQVHPRISPAGIGSAEQWVREKYSEELQAYRARASYQKRALILMVDADKKSLKDRITTLETQGARRTGERIAFFIPRRNIETWIAYLEGEAVDEDESKNYKAFKEGHSPTKSAKELARRCIEAIPLDGAPPSLVAACREWKHRLG